MPSCLFVYCLISTRFESSSVTVFVRLAGLFLGRRRIPPHQRPSTEQPRLQGEREHKMTGVDATNRKVRETKEKSRKRGRDGGAPGASINKNYRTSLVCRISRSAHCPPSKYIIRAYDPSRPSVAHLAKGIKKWILLHTQPTRYTSGRFFSAHLCRHSPRYVQNIKLSFIIILLLPYRPTVSHLLSSLRLCCFVQMCILRLTWHDMTWNVTKPVRVHTWVQVRVLQAKKTPGQGPSTRTETTNTVIGRAARRMKEEYTKTQLKWEDEAFLATKKNRKQ